jgi:DNA modification methylase
MDKYQLHNGDCFEFLKGIEPNSVDSIVTDPPAGIGFFGKDWDSDKGGRDQWIDWMQSVAAECFRALKPGGYALVWSLPRTSHWTGMAWENAGFYPQDKITHIFGCGFPKSFNISKAFDKAAGVEREVFGLSENNRPNHGVSNPPSGIGLGFTGDHKITKPATDLAKQWEGFGTALKPAAENWWLFKKPCEGTIIQNVEKYGTGGLNIDATRVELNGDTGTYKKPHVNKSNSWGVDGCKIAGSINEDCKKGRWPANFINDGSELVLSEFPFTEGGGSKKTCVIKKYSCVDFKRGLKVSTGRFERDSPGNASRYFKSCQFSEIDENLESVAPFIYQSKPNFSKHDAVYNTHPTVKPVELMRYFVRLITPPNGVVLDPFLGSGTTGVAAMLEGFRFVGVDMEKEYVDIAQKRIEFVLKQGTLF